MCSEGDVYNEGGYACVGEEVYGQYVPFFQFYCKPKIALKNHLKKIKDKKYYKMQLVS